MTTIYGLREIGSTEIRYVGFTNQPIAKRLAEHVRNAARGWPFGPTEWIGSAGEIEIIHLRKCPEAIARKSERDWVERLHKQGHRLTNRHLVPRSTGASPTTTGRAA